EKEAADARRLEEMEDKTQELADKGQIRLAPGEIGNVGGLENDLAASWETLLEFAGQNNRVWGTALKQGFELDKLIGVYDQVEKGGLTLIEQPIQTKGGGIETPFVIDYGDDAEPPTKKIEWSVLKEGARELRMDTLNRGMEVNYAAWAPFLQELDDNDKYSPYVEEIDEKLGINWDQVTRENILGNCIYLVMKLESLQYVHNLIKSGELIGEPKVKGPGGKDIESFTLKFDKDGNLTDKAPEGGEQVRVKTYDWSEIEKHHTEDMAAFVSGEVESAQKLAVERQADIKAIEENRSFIESNLMTGIKFDEVNYNSFWSDNFKGERNEDGTWTITEGLFSGNKFPNLEEAYLMMALAVKAKIDIEKDGNWIIRNREAYFEPTVWGYGIDWEPSSWSPFDVGIIDSNVASQMQGRLGNIQFTDLIAKLNNIYSVFNSSYPKTEAA
ncbi:MAG TPA: hypothetical protein VIT68_00785, partial [Candidatus Gracilibacteria bacterium]